HSVLTAAAPWCGQIESFAGVRFPTAPIRRQIAVTGPLPDLRKDFPFVIDFSRALYFHREGGGLLTGMSNRDEQPGFDPRVDEEGRLTHLEQALERLPLLAEADIAAEGAGLYRVTPDDQAILGRLPVAGGLYML